MTSVPLPTLQPPSHSPLIQRPLDNTALATFMTCPRKYYYSMVLHRRSKGRPSPSLAYGTAWHAALETAYKFEPKWQMFSKDVRNEVELLNAVDEAIDKAWEEHDRPDDYRTVDRVKLEYRNYLAHYGMPWDEDAKTVGFLQGNPLVEIAMELGWPGALHPYAGKLDRIIQLQGQFFIEDHKTTSMWSATFFRQFELKNQMMGYAWMAQLITGKQIAGVRINAHVCRKRDSQNERQIISFNRDRLQDWARNYNQWVTRIEAEYDRLNAEVREGLIEHGLPAFSFPHNFDACDTKYGMCQYAGVCSMQPRFRTALLEQDFAVNPWNPLEVDDAAE